jgi:hypothetical protein
MGKATVDVFSISVLQCGKEFEFVVPKPCGNTMLYKIFAH